MGSPAAAGRGGERNFAKPEVDQEHLLDVFKKYVKLLGVQACFSFEPYGNLAKTSAVQAKGLSKASALLKQLHEVEGGLAFKYKDLKECLAKLSKDYPDLVLQAPLTKQSSWAGDKAEMLLILMAHARRLCNETRFKEACSKATQFEIKDLEELRAMLLPEVLPSPPKLQDAATHNTKRPKAEIPMPSPATKPPKNTPAPASSPLRRLRTRELEIPETPKSAKISLSQEAEGSPLPGSKARIRKSWDGEVLKKPAAAAKPVKKDKPKKKPAANLKIGKIFMLFVSIYFYLGRCT